MSRATIGKHGLLNLSPKDLHRVHRLGVRAALLGVAQRDSMTYTQGPARWDYIADHHRAYKGNMPEFGDCSAFVTGVLWDATLAWRPPDFVNGQHWRAGHTGTLVQKGREVNPNRLHLLDLVFYGNEGWRPGHVAIVVVPGPLHGGAKVVSFGSNPGPFLLPAAYRSDVNVGGWAPRRYVH